MSSDQWNRCTLYGYHFCAKGGAEWGKPTFANPPPVLLQCSTQGSTMVALSHWLITWLINSVFGLVRNSGYQRTRVVLFKIRRDCKWTAITIRKVKRPPDDHGFSFRRDHTCSRIEFTGFSVKVQNLRQRMKSPIHNHPQLNGNSQH